MCSLAAMIYLPVYFVGGNEYFMKSIWNKIQNVYWTLVLDVLNFGCSRKETDM